MARRGRFGLLKAARRDLRYVICCVKTQNGFVELKGIIGNYRQADMPLIPAKKVRNIKVSRAEGELKGFSACFVLCADISAYQITPQRSYRWKHTFKYIIIFYYIFLIACFQTSGFLPAGSSPAREYSTAQSMPKMPLIHFECKKEPSSLENTHFLPDQLTACRYAVNPPLIPIIGPKCCRIDTKH